MFLNYYYTYLQGVNTTRRFLLEWLSFLCRYVPVGIIEVSGLPQKINQRPPNYVSIFFHVGRNAMHFIFRT